MPTVLRVDGFRVMILFPPREHPPAHVHVVKGDGTVVIELAVGVVPQRVREIHAMNRADVRRAEEIVAEHTNMLLTKWREIWGE